MTRTSLTVLALLAAGAAALVLAAAAAVPPWWMLPAVPLTWYALTWVGRASHRAWVRWNLGREARRGGGAFLRAVELWGAAPRVSSGDAWFTRADVPTPALERAVLFPSANVEEEAVLAELNASTQSSRRALARGLRDLIDLCVDALASPLHPVFPEAHGLLDLLGMPPPRLFVAFRAEAAWRARRPGFDPQNAEETIAARLILAGMPAAALAALSSGETSERAQRLRRLARFLALMRRGDALRAEEYASWAPELLLLAGRRISDLVPGSGLLAAVRGGAAALEAMVRTTPEVVADLSRLGVEQPDLAPAVRLVLARIASRRAGGDPDADRPTEGAPDPALTLHLRGVALLSERRPREAVAEFEAALAHAPQFPAAAYSLAVARRRLGQGVSARDDLRDYADRHRGDVDAQVLYARFLSEDDEVDEARAVYERTIERFPRSVALRVNFAQALAAWGLEGDAAAQLEAAHGANPTDPRLALLAGRARVHGGRARDAVDPLRLAVDRLSGVERAEAMFWLLSAYREQGRHDKATSLAVKLVDRLGAGQEGMLDEVAEYLEERHDFLRARAASERARRLRGEV